MPIEQIRTIKRGIYVRVQSSYDGKKWTTVWSINTKTHKGWGITQYAGYAGDCYMEKKTPNKLKTEKIEVDLVFDDWRVHEGTGIRSVYNSKEGLNLIMGPFHSGSTFKASIEIPEGESDELLQAIKDGYIPVFWVHKE